MTAVAQCKSIKIMRVDHPAAAVVDAFFDMRESCEHYAGMKEEDSDDQCQHKETRSSWCAMDCCPLLQERARVNSVGWD